MVAGALGTGGLMFGMSQGALAASFAVSGTTFKINADKLEGNGLALYGGEVKSSAGGKAVAQAEGRTDGRRREPTEGRSGRLRRGRR